MKFKDETMQELFEDFMRSFFNAAKPSPTIELLISIHDTSVTMDNFIRYVEQHIAELTAALDEATTCRFVAGQCGYEDTATDKDFIGSFHCPLCNNTGHDYQRLSPASIALCQRIFKEEK